MKTDEEGDNVRPSTGKAHGGGAEQPTIRAGIDRFGRPYFDFSDAYTAEKLISQAKRFENIKLT